MNFHEAIAAANHGFERMTIKDLKFHGILSADDDYYKYKICRNCGLILRFDGSFSVYNRNTFDFRDYEKSCEEIIMKEALE